MISRTRFIKVLLVLLLAASFIFQSAVESEAAQNVNMKIGVADGVSSGRIMGEGLIFTDANGRRGNVRNGAVVRVSGSGLSVGDAVLLMPVTATANSGLGWEGAGYRGRLMFIRASSGFTVVNELDLESYVRGVLSREMGADWPHEALKAQAILARTYAIKNRGRFSSRGYDLDAGQNSQLYGGVNAEDPRTDRAISETAGMILTWDGQPADVFYHSDSGGATADIAHVWGSARPYLQVRIEAVNYTSPNSTWQAALSPSQVTSILSRMNQNVGNVQSIGVALVDDAGRAVQLTFTGDRGTANVRAHDFRLAAGPRVIRSTNLRVGRSGEAPSAGNPQPSAALPPTPPAEPAQPANPATTETAGSSDPDFIEMTRAGAFTRAELVEMIRHPERREEYAAIALERTRIHSDAPAPITPAAPMTIPAPVPAPVPERVSPPALPPIPQIGNPGDFVFVGRGWGHGVGLSQYGARAMAENGMTYDAILAHYFPGTQINR